MVAGTRPNAATGKRVFAICGIPGAGKTTLADLLSERLGWPVLSTGSIARRVDPVSLASGDLADEAVFRRAFTATLAMEAGQVIIDGLPRSREQLAYLPDGETQLLLLTCRPDIARDRLRRRGRPDDTDELIDKRITEQTRLLGLDDTPAWSYNAAGWGAAVNTTYKTPEEVLRGVVAFINGTQHEAF